MMESYIKELRDVQEERIKAQLSVKVTPEEMELIFSSLSTTKSSSSSKSKFSSIFNLF